MDIETGSFFDKVPQALPLFNVFAEKVLVEYPDVQIRIQKTQISFSNKHQFAFVWLPIRKIKNRPDIYIIHLELWKPRNHIQTVGYIISLSRTLAKLMRSLWIGLKKLTILPQKSDQIIIVMGFDISTF